MSLKKLLIIFSLISAIMMITLGQVNDAKASATFGNAAAADILSGETATVDAGQITGTMINKVGSGTVIVPGPVDQVIPKGYYGGIVSDGKIAGVVVPASNVLSGTIIAGTAGTMPNMVTSNPNGIGVGRSNALQFWTGGGTDVYFMPQAGYYDGINTWTKVSEPNLIPANILSGKSILGVTGSLVPVQVTAGATLLDNSTYSRLLTTTSTIMGRSYTVNFTGSVRIGITLFSGNTASGAEGWVYKNGVAIGSQQGVGNANGTMTLTQDFPCNYGDVFTFKCYCTSGSNNAYFKGCSIGMANIVTVN